MVDSVASIHRYPVKGLSAEPLERVRLETGEGLPHDRRFALTRGPLEFDPAQPAWQPKTRFYMLARDPRLAELKTRFDEYSGELRIDHEGHELIRGDLGEAASRDTIARALAAKLRLDPVPEIVEAPGHSFADASPVAGANTNYYVSLISLASIAALGDALGSALDPLRFRANLYLDGAVPWQEFSWLGREVRLGGAMLRVLARIDRCAATNVDPATAASDLNIPKALQQHFGHIDMGVYAEVTAAGQVAPGDRLATIESGPYDELRRF
ncbi:MAG: MOSC domain-containing protein [Alphaproteobacteria bacterium]|jgi:hypothetical protein|nr:MOSC domain-containing protein [Rhodospirillaceae bacterium]MDP6406461.1 MOSC domain-containing protein [Alphaproteobacteria bacterium]MDP6623601.1 MOSC domain-containing protein [Alphaproteobacteria bacterium]